MTAASHVMTVRGPVAPDAIGATSMHDHVFSDARTAWWAPESFEENELTERPLEYRNAGLARWNALGIRDNLYLGVEEYDDQVVEVADFKAAGGGCLVDLTNVGIAPAPAALRRVAEELDLHIALRPALAATKGYSAVAVGETIARARALAEQLERPEYFVPLDFGQWAVHLFRAEHKPALAVAKRALHV